MKKNIKISLLSLLMITSMHLFAQKRSSNNDNAEITIAISTKTNAIKINKSTKTKSILRERVTYKKKDKKIASVRNLPNKTKIKNGNQNYYYANNKYYMNSGGRYIAVSPKRGMKIKTIPKGYKKVRFNHKDYYSFKGVFYIRVLNGYRIVAPEIGTIVYNVPRGTEKIAIRNEVFYEFSNIIYERIQINGSRAYEVVGIIA